MYFDFKTAVFKGYILRQLLLFCNDLPFYIDFTLKYQRINGPVNTHLRWGGLTLYEIYIGFIFIILCILLAWCMASLLVI